MARAKGRSAESGPPKAPGQLSYRLGMALVVILILGGLTSLLFPFISQFIYHEKAGQVINQFEDAKSSLDQAEVAERIRLAQAYNASLKQGNIPDDPFSEEEKEAGVRNYAKMLELHQQIGHIELPSLLVDVPVYAGTAEEVLQKGAGHLEGTSLPVGGQGTHCVITAHRGLPTARLFTDLDKLKIGDKFYYHNLDTVIAYKVVDIFTVEPTDLSKLGIEADQDYMTLLTCTPYMINTHRLLVRGSRIEYNPVVLEKDRVETKDIFMYKFLFYLVSALLFLAILYIISLKLSRRSEQKNKTQLKREAHLKQEAHYDQEAHLNEEAHLKQEAYYDQEAGTKRDD